MSARPDPAHGNEHRRAALTRCSASDLMRWAGLPALAGPATDGIMFSLRRVSALGTLIVEGQPLHNLYCVAAGSFKCAQTDIEGYEQVLGFALHGDMLGLDGLYGQRHASSAVALEDSSVAVMPFAELIAASHQVPALERLLLHATGAELLHRGDTQYLMSAPSSEVRVARFLLHFAHRQAALGHSERRLRLRMTRRDIASCLGVAHETVSRSLTALAHTGCIAVSHRDIEIIDADALREIQRVTRGNSRANGDEANGHGKAGDPVAA